MGQGGIYLGECVDASPLKGPLSCWKEGEKEVK